MRTGGHRVSNLSKVPGTVWHVVLLVHFVTSIVATEEGLERESKVLPIFQVVRFPNDVCTGTTRNGTCFTA